MLLLEDKAGDHKELVDRLVEAGSRFFGAVNHRPDENPRVRVIVDDGRSFLAARRAATDEDRYDVIVSEPSNPWISGVSKPLSTLRRSIDT